MNPVRKIAALVALGLLCVGAGQAKADFIVGNVQVEYASDNPQIIINNTSGQTFTSVTITAKEGATTESVTGLGPIAPGGSFDYGFSGSGLFEFDPDDFSHTVTNDTQFSVTATLADGSIVTSAPFSANSLGVDWLGLINDEDFDAPVFAANLAVVTPEPTSLALFGLGGAALAAWRLRRKKA